MTVIKFANGSLILLFNGEYYSDGIKIKDEALIYQIEQMIDGLTDE